MTLDTTVDESAQNVVHRFVPEAPTPRWPAEVDFILSALDAGGMMPDKGRRSATRSAYHVRATLSLFSDDTQAPPRALYTRDVDARGLGFICSTRLPLSYGGMVELLSPAGNLLTIQCTLFRCREVAAGWYEGALYFNREQWAFTALQSKAAVTGPRAMS